MKGVLHPSWTPERVEAFTSVVRASGGRQGVIDAFQALDPALRDWMAQTVSTGAVGLCGGNAFVVPVLSQGMCQGLLRWSEDRAWCPNEEEEPAYQMDEIVLSHLDAEFDQFVKTALMYSLAPFMVSIFGKLPDSWRSVQMTRYDAGLRDGGNYHVDASSKYTAVIALNDDFEGGGTRLCNGVFGSVLVPPVPVGHALVFRGRELFHKGEAITSGTRKLLTVWSDDDDCQHD